MTDSLFEPLNVQAKAATNPNDDFDDKTEAMDDDMYPNELDESPNSLEDKEYPDDDDYEEIPEDE